MRIGFVGIGNMGQAMAANIAAAGFELVVYDTDQAQVSKFVAAHKADAAKRLGDLADADIVITMLPNDSIVRAVVFGAGDGSERLVPGLREGALIIDMSSCAPKATQELGAELVKFGVNLIDAPVSGGVKRAISGTLSIMVGGEAHHLKQAQAVMKAMGTPNLVGPLGAGHAAKALNNMVSAAGLAAAAEAVVIGERFGIDPDLLIDVLNASTGRNNSTENKFKQYILNQRYDSGFALDLMVKDITLAIEVADNYDVPAELGRACLDVWRRAKGSLPAQADHTAIAAYSGWGETSAPGREQDKN